MACEYFVNGKYISESEFKQLLSEGLLDQLIATNKVENVLDKLLDEAYINEAYKGVTVKNVTIPVSNKINRNYNTERFAQSPEMGQQWNINLTVPQKNPIQVIEESNKQIKAENKKRGEDRPNNEFILGIKVGEGVKFGELSSELESEVSKSLTKGYVRKLEEGIVYMFVPSAYGYSAVRLFSNFLGQTKAAPSIKSKLKQFFEKDLGKEKEITDPYLNKLSYRTKFIKDEEGVKIITTTVGESTPKKVLYKTLEEFETAVLGKFDQKGKYIGETESKGIDGKFFNVKKEPGLLAFVDSEKINSGKYDIEITNNGFITTDAFTEAGNFFNSSSFQIKLSEITGLPEQIKKIKADPKAVKDVESEVENNVAKEEATATSPKNQDTKKEENPIYDEQLPQDVDDFNAALAMGPEGVMFGKDNEPLGEKEEGVEDDDFFKYGNSDNSDFNIDNISPKTKVEDSGWSYQKQNKIDLEKELKYIEDKLGKELIATKTFKTIASIKKYLPEDVYKQLQEIGKNGKSIRGLYTDAAVFLSERAFEGTGYHEAFHVVFNLSLDLPQRFALLREAEERFKSELSEDPSYLEIEELLADKFQEYVLRKGVEDKSLGARISRYFKALFRKLQVFFRPNSRIKLDKIFEDIDLGIYKNKKLSFINTDLSKIKPEYSKFKVEPAFESVAMEADAIKTLKYKSISIIDQLRETDKAEYEGLSDAEVINKIGLVAFYSQLIESLYDQGAAIQAQLQTAKQEGKEEQQKVLEAYFNNLKTLINAFTNKGNNLVVKETEEGKRIFYLKESTEFLKKFNRSLKEYNIKLRPTFAENSSTTDNLENPIDDIEDTSETLEERWDRAAGEFNPIETSSQYLKRKLATIPVRDGNKVLSNSFGTPTFYNSRDVFNFLGKEITDQYTTEGLMEKLKSLESKKPFISNVIELINTDATFRSNLITDLAKKTFVKYTIIYEKDGDYEIIAANQEDFKSIVNQSVIGEFLVEENDLFNKYPKGHPKAGQRNFEDVDTNKVGLRVFELENLLNKIKNASPSNAKEVDSVLKELSETIAKSNINFSVEQLEMIWNPNRRGERASFANILDFTESLIGVFNALEKGDNPFLHLVEEEFIDNKNIKRERKVLERFVSNAFFAYQDQLVAAHRNANGKTVYSIQLSNYLNKQLSTFKNQKDFDNYFEKIKNDPLLSNLPFFKMITDENGKLLSDVTKNLEVTIIDALSRKGKNKAVSYDGLSPIEMVSMQLGLFHNNNKKKYARFTLPTPADSPTMPTIQFKRQSIEEVKDSFVQVALAEIGRINNLKSIPEDSPLRLVKNYYKNGTKFQILSFLNNRVDPDTVTTEELKEAISDFLENEFYESQINKYKKEGVILDYNKETGKIAFAKKVITNQRNANKETFFKEWLFCQYFMNTQMSTVFAGDPSFYKDTVDYQKRYKQIISPGTYTNTDNPDVKLNYSGYIFQDEFVPTAKENADYIIENVKNSNLSPNKKQELISLWTKLSDPKEEETNNVTDAATYVSLDRMIEVYESLGRMTKKHYEAAKRIRKGIETPEDAGMFVITKPFQFTKVYNGGVEVPVQIKNSEFLLTKSFAERSPKLMKVYDLLNNPDKRVDFVAFESAVKVGGLANAVTKDGKPVYSTLELTDGNYELSKNANTITLSQEDWRSQQETPNKYQDKDGNHGSQLRVLMIADMNMEGDYVIGEKKMKGKEVAQLYQDLIVRNLQNSFEEVQKMFLNEDGETINYEVLVEHLRREAEDRNMEEDIYTALETIPDILNPGKQVPAIPLWHPAISYKMESLFNSFFKNRVTRQEINGGSLVDVTSYGVSDQLKYDAKTNTFQALMPLWTKKFFPKDENGKPDITKVPEELKRMIAYRIPTEDKYSIFNIEVVGFADSAAGGGIVLPVEATTLAGLDFDIDKLFLVAPSFYINKNGDPTLIKYIDKDSSSEDIVNSLINSSYNNLESFVNRRFKNEADEFLKLYQEAQTQIAEAYKERKEFFQDEEIQKVYDTFQKLKLQLEYEKVDSKRKALQTDIDYYAPILAEYSKLKDNVEIHTKAFKDLKDKLITKVEGIKKDIDPINKDTELNTKKGIDNKLLEIMTGIMNNPHTQLSSIDTGNFDKLKELANEMRLLKIDPTSKALKKLKDTAVKLIKKKNSIELFSYRDQLSILKKE